MTELQRLKVENKKLKEKIAFWIDWVRFITPKAYKTNYPKTVSKAG